MERARFNSEKHCGQYIDYLYSIPENKENCPIVFYIHGAGLRGNDLSLIENCSVTKEILKHASEKAMIIMPQCHENMWFDLYETLIEFIDEMRSGANIDQNRVYITGASMGSYTAWQIILSHPDWFAAAIPICGGGMYWNTPRLKELPIWAFHGVLDKTVMPIETVNMVSKINANGGNAKITLFPEADHNAWIPAFREDDTWDWLFSQIRGDREIK